MRVFCFHLLPAKLWNILRKHGSVAELVDLVREQLGPDLQDTFAPLRDGGLMLHKIFGIMHDTCATVNLVAELMACVRNEAD